MIPHYNMYPPGYQVPFFPPYPPMPLSSLFHPPSYYPAWLPQQDSDPARPRDDRGLPPWTSPPPIPKLYQQHHPDRHYTFFQDPPGNTMPRPGEYYTGEEDYYREKSRNRGDRGIEIDRMRRDTSMSEERRRDKRRRSNSIERRRDRSESLDRRKDSSSSIDRSRRKRSDSRERDRRDRSYSRDRGRFRDLRGDRSDSRDRSRNFKEERYSRERNRSRDRYVDTRDVRKGEDRQTQVQKNQTFKPGKLTTTNKLNVKVDRSSSKKPIPSPIVVVSSPESISTSTSKHSPIIPQELSKPTPTLRSLATSPKPKPTLPKVDGKSDTLTYPESKQISTNTVLRSDSHSRPNAKPKPSQSTNISVSSASKNTPKSLQNVSKSSIAPSKPSAPNPKPQSNPPFSQKPLLPDPPASDFKFNQTPNLPKAKLLSKSMEKKLLNHKSLLEFGEEFLSMSSLKYRYSSVPSTNLLQILHEPSDAVLGEGRSSRPDKAKMQALFRVLAGYNSELLDRWLDKQIHSLSY